MNKAKNKEGYRDPTANEAIGNVMAEQKRKEGERMLERYDPEHSQEDVIKNIMEKNGCSRTQALSYLRTHVPKESYFQTEIKKALKKKFPDAFITKLSLGNYSQKGIPDIMAIIDGHYFGFEVKRPVFGEASKVQIQTIKWIEKAGGTAAVVTYPEECMMIIEEWRCGNE